MQLHAPKKFTCQFKLLDVNASPFGTHPDGYARNRLSVHLNQIPIYSQLFALYGQFAIAGIKFTYRPKINSTSPDGAGIPASNLLYAEDKNSSAALAATALYGQDNMKTFVSTRGWSKYVSKPRPNLYQLVAGEELVKTITPARQLHWLTPNNATNTDPASMLPHLAAQLCVQDITGAVGEVGQGELWAKVYLLCKEQRIQGL